MQSFGQTHRHDLQVSAQLSDFVSFPLLQTKHLSRRSNGLYPQGYWKWLWLLLHVSLIHPEGDWLLRDHVDRGAIDFGLKET